MSAASELKSTVEALLFASSGGLSMKRLMNLLDPAPSEEDLRSAVADLRADYAGRAVELVEVASGLQFRVAPGHSEAVQKLWVEKPRKYSRTLLETLAIIAYRQPVTRGDIEYMRGVSINAKVVNTLLDRGWIRIKGHAETLGRPALYVTTTEFLDYFGLGSLEDLPQLQEVRSLENMQGDEEQSKRFAERLQAALEQAREEAAAAEAEVDVEAEADVEADSEAEVGAENEAGDQGPDAVEPAVSDIPVEREANEQPAPA
ncbi:MAG: SMC-Scp complex subunit ScpB [Gammaproteobacteria bacterium AqS3]|nr:SMC-Scp complex subunit ScpB [Gammaproteobacteria bacterium AqS3]